MYCVHVWWTVCTFDPHSGTTLFPSVFCYVLLILSLHPPKALEKNKQWLKYDQQREACVTAITARMIWLEKKLNGAKESCSRQHNDNYSHGESVGSGHSTLGHQGARDCHNKVFKISRYYRGSSEYVAFTPLALLNTFFKYLNALLL